MLPPPLIGLLLLASAASAPERLPQAAPAAIFETTAAPQPQPPASGETPPPIEGTPASRQEPDTGAQEEAAVPLDAAERDTLLRIAWRTLVGHLTRRPIDNDDLLTYQISPRLRQPRGCFVRLRTAGETRGLQGDIEATRPLYQQVIVFSRKAATRDPRFAQLTAGELEATTLEITVIGERRPAGDPDTIPIEGHGLFLEKWGRRAVFLPGVARARGWNGARALEELCRQVALPAGCRTQGARVETFDAETIAGGRPAVPTPAARGAAPRIPGEPERPARGDPEDAG